MEGMGDYAQSGSHYNPAGTQHDSTGYGFQPAFVNSQPPGQHPNQYPNYGNQFGTAQYGASARGQSQHQHPNTSTNLAAAALSSLSNHEYNQASSNSTRSNPNTEFSTSWPSQSYATSAYNSTQTGQQSQPDSSSVFSAKGAKGATGATNAASFGRLTMPEQKPATGTSAIHPSSSQTYQTTPGSSNLKPYQISQGNSSNSVRSYSHQQQSQQQQTLQQPPRYASPLHAVQTQQRAQTLSSAGSRATPASHSPQMNARSTSQPQKQPEQQGQITETLQATVDPSQVYDWRAEQQRKAYIEDEKRRKREEEAANVRREAERLATEQAAAEATEKRKEAQSREVEATRLVEEQRKAAAAAARKQAAQEKRKAMKARKAEEASRNKTESSSATAVLAPLSSSGDQSLDEESQMRAMFKRMREFNQRNPAMLAKLWDEERNAHATSSPPDVASAAAPLVSQVPPKQPGSSAIPSGVAQVESSATPIQEEPVPPGHLLQSPSKSAKALKKLAQPSSTASSATQNVDSLWPQHKKGTLSEAAAKWLSNLPANVAAGQTVSKHTVLKILEKNPSYAQLCEELESRGISFARSLFARELLKTMPTDAATSRTEVANGTETVSDKKEADPVKSSQKETGIVSYQSPAFTSLTEHAKHINDNVLVLPNEAAPAVRSARSFQMPHLNEGDSLNSPRAAAPHSTTPHVERDEAPRPPPANKEEAARKRSFNDLIDLTNDDSDDEDGPPPKLLHPSSYGAVQPAEGQMRAAPQSFYQPVPFQNFMQPTQPLRPFSIPSMASPSLNVTPLLDATVANSPTPPVPPKQPTTQQMDLERQQRMRMKGHMLVEPIMRDRVARRSKYDSRTIARDVLLATGRHPDMRSLNTHLNVMQKLLGDHGGMINGMPGIGEKGNRSDLGTIRWDIIDPGGPSNKAKSESKLSSTRSDAVSDKEEMKNNDDSARESIPESDSHGWTVHEHDSGAKPHVVKRGRPSKPDKHLFEVASANRSIPTNTSLDVSTPVRTPKMSNETPTGYAAFKQTTTDKDGNIVKKKGRPIGWRKSIHSREAQGLSPRSAQKKASVQQSRVVSNPLHEIKQPRYQVYACGWLDCSAELHNLDTLKKHLVKLHGTPSNGVYRCAWQNCDSSGMHVDSEGVERHGNARHFAIFDTIEHWLRHVDRAHLQPVAWKLGDGPSVEGEGSRLNPSYLVDEAGRTVTPVIIPPSQSQPEDTYVLSSDPGPRGPGRPTKSTPMRDGYSAAAEMGKLERFKALIGPVMGPEGTRLANAKRRRGFLDDEDFEDVVDGD